MSDSARINGNQISWASLKIKIDGEPYTGITGLDFADGIEVAYGYGTGRHHAPRGRSVGKYTPEPVVMTAWKSTAEAIRQALAKKANGRGIGRVEVPIIVQYIEKDDAVITVELLQSRLVKNENSDEEGPEGLNEKLTWSTMRVLRNGVALYDQSEQGA